MASANASSICVLVLPPPVLMLVALCAKYSHAIPVTIGRTRTFGSATRYSYSYFCLLVCRFDLIYTSSAYRLSFLETLPKHTLGRPL
jgi:hypothetical protein